MIATTDAVDNSSLSPATIHYPATVSSPSPNFVPESVAESQSYYIYDSLKSCRIRLDQMKSTAKNSALLTTLFVATAAQLLSIIRDDEILKLKGVTKSQWNVLNLVSYAALLINALATAAATFLIHALNDVELAELDPLRIADTIKWAVLQWTTYLRLGIVFMAVQPLAYVWMREELLISLCITVMAASAAVGLLVVWWSRMKK
ncbi:hypothetical protein B0H13DRAFT_2088822 [Mycena leptocephala]|nr:hypothetical protein B0H13DRAFT_2088822 [Mycena leptocephala]